MNAVRESLADTLREGADRVESCHQAPAAQAKQTFGAVMTDVIAARNACLRVGPDPSRQATLRRVNALLSLMSSIEFPLAGFHRERMDTVVREMRAIAETASA